MTFDEQSLLTVENLAKHYEVRSLASRSSALAYAVDGVSFSVKKGEILAIVGESGSGKTTVAFCIMKLTDPTSGQIFLEGRDTTRLKGQSLKEFYRQVQIVFQDPYTSLNPRFTIERTLVEPLKTHKIASGKKASSLARDILGRVGLSEDILKKYPHELSGGMRQRVCIARALALTPRLLILDEPTSALDVSMQAKVLNLLEKLRREFGLTFLLITHNMGVVAHMSDRVAVMYLGKIVELNDTSDIFRAPLHPYTKGLISSIPRLYSGLESPPVAISGELPDNVNRPSGCAFHTRCPYAIERCKTEEPQLKNVKKNVYVACFLY